MPVQGFIKKLPEFGRMNTGYDNRMKVGPIETQGPITSAYRYIAPVKAANEASSTLGKTDSISASRAQQVNWKTLTQPDKN